MKVILGKYRPLRLTSRVSDRWIKFRYKEIAAIWCMDNEPDWIDKIFDRVDDALQWVYDHSWNLVMPTLFSERKIHIRVDKWDTWNVDHTLAMIIYPVMKQFKENHHGSPFVKNEDVPEHLHSDNTESLENGETDANWHLRWEWVVDEIVWTFEQLSKDDWREQFYSGEVDFTFEDRGGCMSTLVNGSRTTFKIDEVGMEQFQKRIDNGLRLFGKYYQGIWD